MKALGIREHKFFKPAIGAAMAIACGLILWGTILGEGWVNSSYDYLFRFGTRTVTNKVVLILMDSAAYKELKQVRGSWDRGLHAQLLKQLTEDQCPLVVFDVFFGAEGDAATNAGLAAAIKSQGHVVLMSEVIEPKHPGTEIAQVLPPLKLFVGAAAGCGIGKTDARIGTTARRHWPFPASSEGEFLSLPWRAAELAGARLNQKPEEQWLRYYGEKGAWGAFSYHYALLKTKGYFRDKIVFVGNSPQTPQPRDEEDEFLTPYGRAVGGIEVIATEFLNLMNGDWLRRPPWWVELLVLMVSGGLLGGGLSLVSRPAACGLAIGVGLVVMLLGVSLGHVTNFWFPWLVISGGQVPLALTWALAGAKVRTQTQITTTVVMQPDAVQPQDALLDAAEVSLPDAPDYEIVNPPFGEGAYGRVWLARNAIGQWQALKAVYSAKFGTNTDAYEREFNGIMKYKPISDKHPGLLRVDFVSKKKRTGYFYYVMDLADGLEPGWEQNPLMYKPCDLARIRAQTPGRRLPAKECVRIGLELAAALEFLHSQGLTHRDVKPQNIIFVKGQPKLADVGLVAAVRPFGEEGTWVGTPGYMPPPPESPGTPTADIYGLGMVLYVILTGRDPAFFPELSTTLLEKANPADFMSVNTIVLKACHPDRAQRYSSAAEMATALQQLQQALECEVPG